MPDTIPATRLRSGLLDFLHIVILVLSLFLVISISYDIFNDISFQDQSRYLEIQWWNCLIFLFVFFLEWLLAENRTRYFFTHSLFLIVSIPYLNIIDYYGMHFPAEITCFIRLIPMIRGGYALALVVSWLAYNRISSLFLSYLTILVATVYFASLIFFVAEHPVNPMVGDYGAALWWATMDVTTVGSNIYATTVTGKIMSVVLASLGMMLFPIFTVYVTDLVKNNHRKHGNTASHAAQTAEPAQAATPQDSGGTRSDPRS